jgi:hypothetical protein
MQDCYSVEYEMTDELASRVTRALLSDRRQFRQRAQGSGFFLLVLMVLLYWPTILVLRDQISPAVIVLVFVILAVGFWLMLRTLVYRNTQWAVWMPFLVQPDRKLRLTISDDHISMEMAEAVVEHSWKNIGQIQVFPGLWLLRVEPGGHIALPAANMPPGLEELIRRKAGELGIEIQE